MHFGFMDIISLYSYRLWSVCNKSCIQETKLHFECF